MVKLQPFVQAYLTYQESVWLMNRNGIIVPTGGHLVPQGEEPKVISDIRLPEELIRERIERLSGTKDYLLHGFGNGTYQNRRFITRSPGGQNFHDVTVYFGKFNSKPATSEGDLALLTLSDLERIASSLDHKYKVLEHSRLALEYSADH